MWNVNLLAATRTVEAAMPFMLYRLVVCLGVAVASLFAALAGAGTFIAFASFSAKPGSVASFGAALGLGVLAYLLYRFRGGLFFNMKAGHLPLLAKLAEGETLPQGKAQIELAKENALQVFKSPAGFMEINDAVQQVLQALPARHCPYLGGVANKDLAALLARLAGWVARSGDQALLALCFVNGQTNPWQAVRMGLIAHLRHYESIPKNRGFLMAFEYLGLLAAYAAMLYPANSVAEALPVDVGVWRYVFALIFAWSLKVAFLEPIATTALAGLYFDWVKQEAATNEDVAKELEASGEAFLKITEKAG